MIASMYDTAVRLNPCGGEFFGDRTIWIGGKSESTKEMARTYSDIASVVSCRSACYSSGSGRDRGCFCAGGRSVRDRGNTGRIGGGPGDHKGVRRVFPKAREAHGFFVCI